MAEEMEEEMSTVTGRGWPGGQETDGIKSQIIKKPSYLLKQTSKGNAMGF